MLTARAIVADSSDTAPDEVLAQSRAAGWDEAAIEAQRTRGWNMFQRMIFTLPRSYVRIADGETLDMGRHRWRVVTRPGHSPDNSCPWNKREGVLVAGGQVRPARHPNLSVTTPHTPTAPPRQCRPAAAHLLPTTPPVTPPTPPAVAPP